MPMLGKWRPWESAGWEWKCGHPDLEAERSGLGLPGRKTRVVSPFIRLVNFATAKGDCQGSGCSNVTTKDTNKHEAVSLLAAGRPPDNRPDVGRCSPES